jgi:glycosyltransferase involved in cell wall biosynthesis
LRLGLVIYGSLNTISGGFLYDRRLVDYLRHRGEEVEVISLPWRRYARQIFDNCSLEILRRLSRAPVDALLQDELCHPSLFWLNRRLRRRRPQTPVIAIVHHLRASEARPAWQNRFYRLVERRYLQTVDGFIFNSRATAGAVLGVSGRNRPGVVAAPGGDRFAETVSDAQIRERVQAAGPLRVLFLGNLIPRKGLHTLITALAALPRREWRLTVTGSLTMDAAYARSLRRRVEHLGLTGQVNFTGPLLDGDVAGVLAESHVLAVPSSYEGYGIVYLEGMGFGLPAIATTAGGAQEIITHGKDGFLVAPEDAAGLARCLARWLHDRDKLLAMSLAARQTFLAHPAWDESCAKIHTFLKSFIANRGLHTSAPKLEL